ncbi:hypothetical protein EV132_103596 [Rhizobium sullae]|uniref:Uncharacterized protein n=1 Tax=Rhizobium sullae TaxID=50338 RepID=A0A4R3QAX9_RHISU|nr:hypothetical protein EV132_103596 [Rhizobium sullae]
MPSVRLGWYQSCSCCGSGKLSKLREEITERWK